MLANQRITALRPTRRSPDRATVRVEGKVVATLSMKRIAELGLEVGQPWNDELAEQVAQAATFDRAMKKAMNRLGRRMLSRRQLDDKLRTLEFEQPVRQRVLDRLTELNLLDDEAFGRALIRDILLRKPAGPRLLQQKLFQKGIDRSLADRLVAEAVEPDDQVEQAVSLTRKRLRSMQRLDGMTRKRRLYGLLARRGFAPDTIDQAMRAVADELRDTDE